MSDTEHRNLQEWVRELGPNAIWFLLTLVGTVVAAGIVSSVPSPSVKPIVIGIGLSVALLIAWLSWFRERDNNATRELTMLQRIEKLQKASVDRGRRRKRRDLGGQRKKQEQPQQQISVLENSHVAVAEPVTRTEFGDLTTSPRWGNGEQDAHQQWERLNAAEKAIVRFVLLRGTTTAAHLLQFRDSGGSRSTDTCAGVKEKTSFLLGDLENGLTINPKLKSYVEKIIVQDKRRGVHGWR
jgi:hypothetical protein